MSYLRRLLARLLGRPYYAHRRPPREPEWVESFVRASERSREHQAADCPSPEDIRRLRDGR